jgi:twitching motility protein PilT
MTNFDLWNDEAIDERRPAAAYAGLPPAPPARSTLPAESVAPPAQVAAAPPPAAEAVPEVLDQPDVVDLPPLPRRAGEPLGIDDFLRYSVEVKASDLHIKADAAPTIRISGHLHPLDHHVLAPEETFELASMMMGDKERVELDAKGEVDFAYSARELGRFRVNIHRQRGSLGIAARRILPDAPNFGDLRLPSVVERLAGEHRGLLLVTGPTSSGKTTTCGAVIKHINHTRRCHIVTIEDPIEIMHEDALAIVTQREVGQDTTSFQLALRAAMRQDPDVIFVGEIRDTETVQAALQAAETGHLVIATLHTTDVVETVNRIVDFFPAHQHKQVRVALAGSLVGVMTQRLLPKVGGGRVPAIEVLVSNGRVQDCIIDPEKTNEIHDIVQASGYYGMQTFDQALIGLYRDGLVTLEDAKSAANSAHDFELALQQAGLLAV